MKRNCSTKDANPRCQFTIPASASAVIDDLKIWH